MPSGGTWPAGSTDEPEAISFRAPGTVQHFAPDRQIFADGEASEHFYRVVSGVVRACKYLSDGRRQIEAFYVAGDMFGLEADTRHSLTTEAVNDATVVSYRRNAVEAAARKDAALSAQLMSATMRALGHARNHSLVLNRRCAAEKLASFLIECAARTFDEDTILLPMTRQDIADYLGLTIETVSRTMTQMERDRLIALSNTRQVHLRNRSALEDLVT
jgi:CRP/FNR family nitrogen fixation transcriptional regulator